MADWTYDGDPSGSNTDAVRDLTGQNSSSDDVTVSDNFITWALAQRGSNVFRASALVCEALASKYAAQPTRETVLSQGLTWGDRAKAFRERARELSREVLLSGVSLHVGGMSKAEQDTDEKDSDLRQPQVTLGMHDNPLTGTNSTST
jgi:hypothetical protein